MTARDIENKKKSKTNNMEKFKIAKALLKNEEKIKKLESQLLEFGFYGSRSSGLMMNDYIQFQYNCVTEERHWLYAYISCSFEDGVDWAINGFKTDNDEITEELINHCILASQNTK
jgi:hypothetical protein